MEKDKGLFSFRKHPVGDFLDEKEGRKRKGGRLRQSMGFLMAAALIFNTLPASGLAVSASGREAGLCEHHTEHTPDCGYREAQPCTHEHTEECYKTVTECVHTHTDGCYPETGETEESTGEGNATPSDAGNREPSLCTHVCSEESGCVTKVLDCHHEHDESCGYQEAQDCGYVCEICNGTEPEDTGENTEDTGTDTAKCICETLCTEDSINGDCPVCGADDASLLDCKGKAPEENTENQEDTGICKHHQEHDADCGYISKSEDGEGSPCTYKCHICPVEDLIAALPDKITEDNEEELRAQLEEILALYGELTEGEQGQLDLSRVTELQAALDGANAPMAAEDRAERLDTDEASVTIGGETLYYATLEEAFAAANGKTATITMLNDAECIKSDSTGAPLSITGGNVTLDLNGKTLSGRGYGNYGIINVSGGSLLVEGNGNVNTDHTGLSCYNGGTLTVAAVTINLVRSENNYTAITGVENDGGIVILNGTKITGEATEGQICHYIGTTTIHNVTATGATENCPESVWYGANGTLTINGGTFNKIVVDSGNYGGVKSVAELLGEGYACKKQDGTWATADELAAMEISNVTVKEIPLTIQPQGDTSWYYGSPHTLEMNAAPVNGRDPITYVWKNGNETLGYTSDACTVPADTPVGSYTYTCEATCDGYTLSHTFTFKIEKSGTKFEGDVKTYNGDTQTTTFNADDTITVKATPAATGTAPAKAAARLRADPVAGEMAVYVGDKQMSIPVGASEDGTYTMNVSAADVLVAAGGSKTGITLTARFIENGNMADGEGTVTVNITAAAKIENGSTTTYVGESGLDAAFNNSDYAGATFTLLANVTRATTLRIKINCDLDLNGHTIRMTGSGAAIQAQGDSNVTIRGTGEIISANSNALTVLGTATLEGGTFTSASGDQNQCAVITGTADARLSVTGDGVVIRNTGGGYGLAVNDAQSVQLSGGTYSGGTAAIAIASQSSPLTLGGLLANSGDTRYAYFDENGANPFTGVLDNKSLTGTVTVKACEHTVAEYMPNEGADTHTKTCLACGETWDAEDCAYGDYTHDDTNHTQTCNLCGYEKVEAHTIKCTAEASGTVIAVSEACKTCGYGKDLGTVTIHIPKLVYGDLAGVVTAETALTETVAVAVRVDNNPSGSTAISPNSHPTMATLTGNVLLSAGTHQIKIEIIIIGDDDNYLADCLLPFTVDPAPLTADMVTLGQTDVTYNGTEQKPALSVKQGETTLTEGTDYEVSYKRGDAATTDFTNAGTVKITVTGKGNYTGTVTKEYAIGKADVPAGNLAYTPPTDLIYTGQSKTAAVTVKRLTGIGTVTVKYKKDNSGDMLAEAKEPGTYHVYADISAGQNYNAAQIEMGSFIISYMATPTVLYNGGEKKDWYNEDVDISADSTGYTVSDAVDGDYKSPYHISAQEGTVAKTLYFMDASGHISAGVDVEVKFDLTPPTGEIAVGAKWWQNVLHFISFGNYAAKEYTVTIKAEDKNGSGNSKIEYDIVTGSSQYTDADTLKAANLSWTKYNSDSKPTVPVSNSQYVVYARLTDNAGNVTYISTDGILLDNTPPAVENLSVPEDTKKDVTADFTFTVSEAADYYYVVLPESSAAPSAEDIIVTCGGTLPEGKTGNVIAGMVSKGSGAVSADTPGVSVEAENLSPNTAYTVYVTAVDRAVDITDSAEGTPAGNIADVQKADFTTKKTLPYPEPMGRQ